VDHRAGVSRSSSCNMPMLRAQILTSCLLAAVAASGADGPTAASQLRGSVAAPAEQATAKQQPSVEHEDEMLQLTQCRCSKADCTCSSSVPGNPSEEQEELQRAILNQTKELHAFWEASGGLAGQMACSCESGSSTCRCDVAGDPSELEAAAEGHSALRANETLLNDKEQAMSLWWAGHAGWVHGGGWRRGWRPGFRCGRGGFGGCRCGGLGCRCGGARGGGCGWR